MSKKLISLFVGFVYLFSSVVSLAATHTDVYAAVEAEKQAISLMVSLGIMEESALSSPDENVTRLMAAHYISSMIAHNIEGESRTIFADLDKNDEYANDVTLLTDLQIINPSALNFRPNDNITGFEFIKMIVSMIGQGYVAEQLGGYPSGYLQVAQKNKLLGGLSFNNNNVTIGEFALVLSEALESKYVFYNEFYTFDTEGESYMYSILGLERCSGILNDNAVTNYTGKSQLSDNEFSVDGQTFYFDGDVKDLIGSYVNVYYKTGEKEKNAYRALSVKRDNTQTEITTLKYDEIASFKNNTYTYYDESDREKTLKIDNETVVMYNGMALSAEQYKTYPDIYVPSYGEVELINNNSSSAIDVVKITDYRNIIVSSYNTESMTVYAKNGANPVILDDISYTIKDISGTPTDFSLAVKAGNSLMVAESLNKDYVQIVYSSKTVTGKITEVNSHDNTFKIGDALYLAAPDCNKAPTLGTEGTFYLNAYNNVVYIDTGIPNGYTIAYVIDFGKDSGLSATNKIRVFTHYDMLKTLSLSDSVIIDGDKYSGNSDAAGEILKDNIDEIILLKLNAKGEITQIDTPLDNSDNGISPVDGLHHANTRYHNDPGSTFAGKMFVTENTYCFVVPQKMDEEQISVIKGANAYRSFLKGVQIDQEVAVYRYGEDKSVEVFALANKMGISGTMRGKGCPLLVTDIRRTTNSQGNECYKLSLNRNGTISEVYTATTDDIIYTCDGVTYTISVGDLIIFGTDKFGFMSKGQLSDANQLNKKLENITLIYDAEKDWFNSQYTPDYSSEYSVDMNTKHFYIYDRTDLEGHFKVTYNDPSEVVNEDNVIAYNFSNMRNILLYDSETEKITSMTHDEFITYKDAGENCTRGVFFMNYLQNGGFCVVYK